MSRLRVSAVSELNFGGFSGGNVGGLAHDFVVVFGRNEAGKSTVAEFIAWMLAGPEGDSASARRFGDAGAVIGGRLTGDISGSEVDIAGNFRVLERGAPSDTANRGQNAPRRGTIGGNNVDSLSLRERFGLGPDQYSLLLRFRAETMHILDNENLLLDLFSRYAAGSINSAVEPRSAIAALESKSRTLTRQITENQSAVTDLNRQIAVASSRPESIRDLEKRIADLETESAGLSESLTAVNALVAIVQAAVDSFDKQEQLRVAESQLDGTEPVPPEWTPILDVLDEAAAAADAVVAAEREVAGAQPLADELSARIGLGVDILAGQQLTTTDRDILRDAAHAVTGAESATAGLDTAHALLVDEEESFSQRVEEAIRSCGEPAETLRRHAGALAAVRALSVEADEADKAHTRARQARLTLEEKTAQREAAERDMSNSGPAGEGSPRRPDIAPVLALAVTVGLVVVASFVHQIAAVAVALAGGVVSARLYKKAHRASVSPLPEQTASPLAAVVASRRQDESAARLLHDTHTSTAVAALEALNEKLAGRGFSSAKPGAAFSHVTSIELAVTRIDEQAAHSMRVAESAEAVKAAGTRLSVAGETYGRLFAQRGVTSPPLPGDFDNWAAEYSRAIDASARFAKAASELQSARDALEGYRQPVQSLRDAPNANVVASRIRDAADKKSRRDAAEAAVAGARSELRVAVGDRQGVVELLGGARSREELVNQLTAHQEDARELDERRINLNQEIGALKTELNKVSGVEELPYLMEKRDTHLETISEVAREVAVITVAVSTLRAVVDRFELENQGPVVARAQGIIDRVDPAFGRLFVDRSGDSPRLRIERANQRLDVSRLSTGARTIVYMALRLAFVAMDAENRTVALPLLCDDPVVALDDQRLTPVVTLLAGEALNRQVLLFTCHQRTVDVARSLGAHIVNL